MWYVSKTLMKYGYITSFIIIALILFTYWGVSFENGDLNSLFTTLTIQIFINSAILFLAFRIKRGVEKFLHYQRVREIFYVLETAYTAAKSEEDGMQKIFGGLKKPSDAGLTVFPNAYDS